MVAMPYPGRPLPAQTEYFAIAAYHLSYFLMKQVLVGEVNSIHKSKKQADVLQIVKLETFVRWLKF